MLGTSAVSEGVQHNAALLHLAHTKVTLEPDAQQLSNDPMGKSIVAVSVLCCALATCSENTGSGLEASLLSVTHTTTSGNALHGNIAPSDLAMATQPSVSGLLERLKATPTDVDIETAVTALCSLKSGGDRDALSSQLRTLMLQDQFRPAVWRALGKHRVTSFEASLLAQLRAMAQRPPQELLAAITRSATNESKQTLVELALATPSALAPPADVRHVLLNTLLMLDKPYAVNALLRYYADPSVSLTPDSASQLSASLLELYKSDHIASVFVSLILFGAAGQTSAPLKVDAEHKTVLLNVAQAVVRDKAAIAMLSFLLFLTDFEDRDLADIATPERLDPLRRHPWLFAQNPLSSWLLPPTKDIPPTLDHFFPKSLYLPKTSATLKEWLAADTSGTAWLRVLDTLQQPKVPLQSQTTTLDLFGQSVLTDVAKRLGKIPDEAHGDDTFENALNIQGIWIDGNNRRSFSTVRFVVTKALTSHFDLGKYYERLTVAEATTSYVTDFVLRERALELYLLTSGMLKRNIKNAIDWAHLDEAIDAALLKTTMATTEIDPFMGGKTADQVGRDFDAGMLASCSTATYKVVKRSLNFDLNLFQEALEVHCTNHVDTLVWIGQIPTSLTVVLRRHPQLLEFAGISLAAKQILEEATYHGIPDELDIVTQLGNQAIPYFAAYGEDPAVRWRDVSEVLRMLASSANLANAVVDSSSLQNAYSRLVRSPVRRDPPPPARRPEADILSILNVSQDVLSGADFSRLQDRAKDWLTPYFLDREQMRFLTAIKATVNQQPSSIPKTTSYCQNGQCGSSTTIVANPIYAQYNGIVAQINARANNQAYATTTRFSDRCANVDMVWPYRVKVNEDVTRFVALYSFSAKGEECKLMVEGQLQLPDTVHDGLVRSLRNDPWFLTRHKLDLIGAIPKEFGHMVAASDAFGFFGERVGFAEELTRRMGLWGPATVPIDTNLLDEKLIGDNAESRIIVTEIRIVRAVHEYIAVRHNILDDDDDLGEPERKFIAWAVRSYSELEKKLDADTDGQAADAIAKMQAKQPITISFGVSWPGPFYSLAFTIGSLGGVLSLSPANILSLAPTVDGVTLPAVKTWNLASVTSSPIPFVTTHGTMTLAVGDTENRATFGNVEVPPMVVVTGGALTENVTYDTHGIPRAVTLEPARLSADVHAQIDGDRNDPATRRFIGGLMVRALPALTPADRARLVRQLLSKQVDTEMVDLLIKRGNEAVENERIADGDYLKTSVAEGGDLVPVAHAGRPCPVPSCVDSSSAKDFDDYIANFNAGADQEFRSRSSELAAADPEHKPFLDGMPKVELVYGNNYTVMLMKYRYQMKDGSSVVKYDMMRTPFQLVDMIRKDPSGHVLEKWTMLATDAQVSWSSDAPSKLVFEKTARGFLEKRLEDVRWQEIMDKTAGDLAKQLGRAFDEYWARFREWAKGNASTEGGVREPFVPNAMGVPYLALFCGPDDVFDRRIESLAPRLSSERETNIVDLIRDAEIDLEAAR